MRFRFSANIVGVAHAALAPGLWVSTRDKVLTAGDYPLGVRPEVIPTRPCGRDNNDMFLTLGEHPVLLPPKLAALIEEHIADPCYRSMVRPPAGHPPRYLLPASRPGKPRSARTVQKLLRQYGLPTLAARNTAMIEAVSELPPIVIADLFGIHPGTAHAWAKFAQASWTDYLAAGTTIERAGPESPVESAGGGR